MVEGVQGLRFRDSLVAGLLWILFGEGIGIGVVFGSPARLSWTINTKSRRNAAKWPRLSNR